MRLFTLIFIFLFSFHSMAQFGYLPPYNPPTCNGYSDGSVIYHNSYAILHCGINFLSGAELFFWSNGETTANIYNLSAGTYYLTVVSYYGDQCILQTIVNDPGPIQFQNFNINPDCDTCANGSISIQSTGGTAPYTYNWSTGSTTPEINNLLWGSYNLSLTDDNGCEANEEFFLMFNPPDTQEIALGAGWNMFSTYKSLENPPLDTLLSSIQGNYLIVKNWEGEVYWPQYNVNTFDSVEMEYGFQIKMTNTDTLKLTGPTITPENYVIFLPLGWSTIGYPRYVAGPISELMSYQVNHILIMKDDIGQVWWPQYGVNLIQAMQPGEAYQIKIDTWMNFTYPSYLENH